jgi:hypothetical protein
MTSAFLLPITLIFGMIHNLPVTPAFRDERPDSPISEIALPVLVEFEGGETHVIGTATLIGGYLAITAKHVLEHALREFGVQKKTTISQEVRDYAIRLYQVMPGPVYRIWNVCMAWYCETDIAILHLGLSGTSEPDRNVQWRVPPIRATPPPVGQKIIAFGYRESVVKVTPNEAGGYHLELQDKPSASFGEVKRIYPEHRDSIMLPFPCYEVNARLDPGMSGGLVIDESGAVCGLVCVSLPAGGPGEEAVSHITILWPMLRTVISADRAGNYPKGLRYPMIDLALDGLIHVVDLALLNPKDFPGRLLPPLR